MNYEKYQPAKSTFINQLVDKLINQTIISFQFMYFLKENSNM